jgi:hypothetical protein
MEHSLHAVRVHNGQEAASQIDFPGLSRAVLFAFSESRKADVDFVEVVHGDGAAWNSAEGWGPKPTD